MKDKTYPAAIPINKCRVIRWLLIIIGIAAILTIWILVAIAVRYDVSIIGSHYEETLAGHPDNMYETVVMVKTKDYSNAPRWVELFSENAEDWLVGSIIFTMVTVCAVVYIKEFINKRKRV